MRFLLLVVFLLPVYLQAQAPIHSDQARHHPVIGRQGMVASQHPEATRVGLEILQRGGNAVDAAVGVGFALAVVLPRAGNLGGGGFMLVYDAKSGKTQAINYRERAPKSAGRDMYLDDEGSVVDSLSRASYQAIAVPGTVAGLALALEKYGTMSLEEVIAPAIELAGSGFTVTHDLERVLVAMNDRLSRWPESRRIFLRNGKPYRAGELLMQPDLTESLKQISAQGPAAFYSGPIAKKLVASMKKHGGLITANDLANYQPQIQEAVWGEFSGYRIASMPPPSSGGVHLIQILNMLEQFDLKQSGHNSAATIHLLSEAMKRAYADRSKYLGDPEFWEVPVAGLTDKNYAKTLAAQIAPGQATSAADILPGKVPGYESEETTHFSVTDRFGNVVSNTYTLNYSFGMGAVAEGTGILLNNQMDDFSAKPGSANGYGLIGNEANRIEPNKRPLSSMTPVIVFKDDQPFLTTGSPGGSKIITAVLQVMLNVMVFEQNIAQATHAPRIHHQWLPDRLLLEEGISPDTEKLLRSWGHPTAPTNNMGSTQSILMQNGFFYGCSDPRRPDAVTLGY